MNPIKLVVSDCDGTLVTPAKQITDATRKAVSRLRDAGIEFTITSSRPSYGMRMLIAPLGITLPIGAFNGSSIVGPDMSPLTQHVIPPATAQKSLDLLAAFGVDAWVLTDREWLVAGLEGPYISKEILAIETDPSLVESFAPYLDRACKIVGVSADPAKLARCETAMQKALGETAHAARSQTYYLDVTPPGQDKGSFIDAMAVRLGIATSAIATLGDMRNDVAMFKKSGISFAMGNAPDDVKAEATHVTATNSEDGFAKAIDMLLT